MDNKSFSYKVIFFILDNLVSFFKIKDVEEFYNCGNLVLSVLGFLIDVSCILVMALKFGKVAESIVAFFILGLVRVGKGEHYDSWFDCFVLSMTIFLIYLLFITYFSNSWELNILVIFMTALLFIKWGEYYPVLKNRVRKLKEWLKCRLKL